MSLFRKRSISQSSFSYGPDEISVSRIVPDAFSRESRVDTVQSTRSSCSEIDPSDFAIHESCVVRNFPKHKSSHLRFLAWVAYTRKYTDESITDIERRTCPLLWCREQFLDQDAMLKHVWNCPHLSKGLYWCFHCQKPERVGKFQCKRCQGVPSRTDRMASVAKKIFSKLGSKGHRNEPYATVSEGRKSLANIRETGESSKSSDYCKKSEVYHESASGWDHQYIQELPNTFICPEMAADWTAASHELPDTYISEMTGTEIPIEMGIGAETWTDNFYSASLEDWEMPPPPPPKQKAASPRPATLRVDTSFSSLTTSTYQGRVSQQKHSSQWQQAPLSPMIISPLSAGPVFSATSLEISPTDSDASGGSFFADSGYSSATTTISTWNMPVMCEPTAELEGKRGTKRAREEEPVFEDWLHDLAFSGQTMLTAPTSADASLVKLPETSRELIHSEGECAAAERPRFLSGHWCDAPTLVHSFSEALDAHIEHTKSALRDLPSTSITQELLAMSKTSMVSIGLEALASILEGRKPTAIVQVFAFTHIACAFVIATKYNEGKVISQAWFKDILAWVHDLASAKQRQMYMQIARSIWKPADDVEKGKQVEIQLPKPKENALFSGCKHFLDVLESFNGSENEMAASKDKHLASIHRSFATRVRFNNLISSSRPFADEVVNVERRLLAGEISSTRQLELELVCAGKLAAQSDAAYEGFVCQVTQLCDSLYEEESRSRTAYYMKDISLVKQLLPEENYSEDEESHASASFLGDRDGDLLSDLDFNAGMHSNEASLVPFFREADEILRSSFDLYDEESQPQSQPLSRNTSHSSHTPLTISRQTSTSSSHSQSDRNSSTPQNPHLARNPAEKPTLTVTVTVPSPSPSPITDKHHCHCGYVPSGEEKWKASNLRRHKRTQHPELKGGEAKVYKCRFAGCKSTFTRSDNLRSHQRDKGHEGLGLGLEIKRGFSGEKEHEKLAKRRRIEIGMGGW